MRTLARAIPLAILILVLTACSGIGLVKSVETPEQGYYVAVAVFNELDKEAFAIASNSETPQDVRAVIVEGRNQVRSAIGVATEAFNLTLRLRVLLYQNPDDLVTAAQLDAAATAFSKSIVEFWASVDAFRELIAGSSGQPRAAIPRVIPGRDA